MLAISLFGAFLAFGWGLGIAGANKIEESIKTFGISLVVCFFLIVADFTLQSLGLPKPGVYFIMVYYGILLGFAGRSYKKTKLKRYLYCFIFLCVGLGLKLFGANYL